MVGLSQLLQTFRRGFEVRWKLSHQTLQADTRTISGWLWLGDGWVADYGRGGNGERPDGCHNADTIGDPAPVTLHAVTGSPKRHRGWGASVHRQCIASALQTSAPRVHHQCIISAPLVYPQ